MKYRRGRECALEIDLRSSEFESTGGIELIQERDSLMEYRGHCDVILTSTKEAYVLTSCITIRVFYKIFRLISLGPNEQSNDSGV